ncbi:MAG: hypothetical protein KTR24_13630 [Saprospiraceae bacterium]|nr:hypothetical protein [Saprospiraceae bacterium]
MAQKNGQSQLIAVGSVIIIALLGVIGWLVHTKNQQAEIIQQHELQLSDAEQVKVELEKEYYQALSDLEEMRGSNTELNALIETQKEDLRKQKVQIGSLISNKKDLAAARVEIQELREQASNYIVELTQLKEENAQLAMDNGRLTEERDILTGEVNKERQLNDELLTVKASLVEEKEGLMTDNEMLSSKVNRASVINVTDIDVQGYKIRSNGKEVKKGTAKNVDLLKICFKANENPIVSEGNEQFFVRIINPQGETVAVESAGSGVLTNFDTSEELRYTKAKEMMYTGTEAISCLSWQTDGTMAKGLYSVEVYNKGFLSGKSTFKMN